MRIGDQVIRVKGQFNQREVGSIEVIRKMKVYNGTVVLNFYGDKEDTWNGMSNFRAVDDVDIPMLNQSMRDVEEQAKKAISERKNPRILRESISLDQNEDKAHLAFMMFEEELLGFTAQIDETLDDEPSELDKE